MSDHLGASRSDNLRGAGFMTLAMAGYVVNDTLVKLVTEDLPLFQTIFLRGLVVTGALMAIMRLRGDLVDLRRHLHPWLGLRVAMETAGTVLYLLALTQVPLAGLTAILQIVPLAVTFAAARLLREAVDPHRVGAVLVGFCGVMLIVRPGSDDFSPWFISGLAAVAMVVVRELATRRMPASVPSLVAALATAVAITTMGGLVSIVDGWVRPDDREVLLLLGAASFLAIGYTTSINAVRVGDMSFTAPFRYSILLFAIALQIVVFDEVPDALTLVGSAIIGLAGLYAYAREQRPRMVAGPAR